MSMIKRTFSFLLIFIMIMSTAVTASKDAVTAVDIKDGNYNITVTSSSSMFRIVNCELIVKDGAMSAVMTLSGTGYEKLFMGTGEEAEKASDDEYAYFVEDENGKYTYTVPIEALDKDTDCAAFSIRKQKWYDRTLVFESTNLPESAYQKGVNPVPIIAIAVIAIAAIIVLLMRKKKTK